MGNAVEDRLIRSVVAASWERDVASGAMRWTPGFEMFGYAPDEPTDPSWWSERVHPDDVGRVRARFDEAVAGSAAGWSDEYRFRRRDGTWADVAMHAFVDRDDGGSAVRACGVMMDVTRQKETERALRLAQRALLEAQRIGQMRAWEEDLRTGMVHMDYAGIMGERDARYEPRPRDEALRFIHPDDLERLTEVRRRTIEGGGPFETEYRMVRPDGAQRVVLVRGELLRDEAGAPERILGTALDITDRTHAEAAARRSQRLLELVLETLPVAVSVMNADADIVLTNAALRTIWGGVIRPSAPRYDKSIGYWHDSGKRIAVAEWASQRALTEGVTSLNEVIDIETFQGKRKTMRNSAAPIRDDAQRIVGVVVVNEDVTQAVRAHEELGRRERQEAALAQLGLSALKSQSTQALFEETAALVAKTLAAEYGLVLEWLPDEERMRYRAGHGPWIDTILRDVVLPTSPGFMAWFTMRSRAPVVVEDLPRETRFEPCELLMKHGVRSGIAVTIAGSPGPFGVLEVNTRAERRFTYDEVNFVWGLANVLAISIERERAAAELGAKREQLQALSRRLITAQEEERRAIARELHDDFGQVLTALRLNLQRGAPDEKENITLVDGAIARMRDLAQDLRPPQLDELGLESSLRWYMQREASRAGLELALAIEALPDPPAPVVATTCFRVAQEALTNVIRHARANRVYVALRAAEGRLELVVRDDGVGFDVAAARTRAARGASQGLLGMGERVDLVYGELQIDSAPGRGTTIRALLPLGGGARK